MRDSSKPWFFYYLSIYRKYLGRRIYVVVVLSMLAAFTEGIGLSMLSPLLMLIDTTVERSDLSGFSAKLNDMLAFLGLEGSFTGILLFISGLFLFKGALEFGANAYNSYLYAQLMREVKGRLFDAYCRMGYSFYSHRNTGHFVNMVNVQVDLLVNSFEHYKVVMISMFLILSYFTFAFLINWQFAGMAAIAGGSVFVFFRGMNRYAADLSRRSVEAHGLASKMMVQAMQSFKYVASTAQIPPLKQSVMSSVYTLTGYLRNQGIVVAFARSLREPISVVLVVGIILIQVQFFKSPLAPIFVSLLLIHRAVGQVMAVQTSYIETLNRAGSLESVEREFQEISGSRQPDGDTVVHPLRQNIELKDVTFAYDEEMKPVLRDVSLVIKANTTVALVGESGAGKSTLVDILTLLLRPQRGEVYIDAVPGSQVNIDSWRRQIGYVSQETVVFDDTVANNICMWQGDYNKDPDVRKRVEEAAARAYALEFIQTLPDGFNTVVGDRGILLSGGQRQRLFIARELYRNPRFLILDEATSALDSASEQYVKQSIDDLKGATTVVIIAHRLSTIRNVDYIYVLDKERIVESGSYEELVSAGDGRFKRMVSLQNLQ